MQIKMKTRPLFRPLFVVAGTCLLFFQSCGRVTERAPVPPVTVSVLLVDTSSLVTTKQFSGMLEGINNIEIRSQAEGFLEKIFVDEGDYVEKGQPLFLIQDGPYTARLNQASARLLTAKAKVEKAEIELDRLENLEAGKVISVVQLKNAETELKAAKADVALAEATRTSELINKSFTRINAPVSGYIGKLPYRAGSLIGKNETLPLTLISDIRTMYAYFSVSEEEFLQFKQSYQGKTIEEKIDNIPPVNLKLPDESIYPEPGKIDLVQGQFDKATASITFRASFSNRGGLLRSGNTGKVLVSKINKNVVRIPQSATYELQNRVMAYTVGKDRKLSSVSLNITDKDANFYIVSAGLKPGDRIVTAGLERLHEGMCVAVAKPNL